MGRRLPDKTRRKIKKLYQQGVALLEIVRRTGASYGSVYNLTRVKERGFINSTAYRKHLAKQKGYATLTEYYDDLAKARGYNSYQDYVKERAEIKMQREENREIASLIRNRLREMDRSQSWFAKQLGVSGTAVSKYARGIELPGRENRLYKLLDILCPDDATRKRLEDLLSD